MSDRNNKPAESESDWMILAQCRHARDILSQTLPRDHPLLRACARFLDLATDTGETALNAAQLASLRDEMHALGATYFHGWRLRERWVSREDLADEVATFDGRPHPCLVLGSDDAADLDFDRGDAPLTLWIREGVSKGAAIAALRAFITRIEQEWDVLVSQTT